MAGQAGLSRYQRLMLVATTIMLMLHHAPTVRADILVYQMLNDQIIEEFRDLPGTFGGEIPDTGMKVLADRADPPDGCTEMRKPPNSTSKFAVVIARYNCSFEVKVRNAQQAGYAMAIVHNVGSNDLEHMSASHPQDLLIPSVFVGESSGRSIIEAYTYAHDYALVITDDIPFNISNNLIIPFAIVVGLCFIIMVLFMIIRCIRERRRTLRNRLPARLLKRIGIVKFAKGMQFDTCAICLDDFVENERLRVLPCRHAYHAQCIDPWLTKNRRVCPICKRKVIVRGERLQPRRRWPSDSMSSSDPDETTPLLNSANDNNPVAAGAATPPATTSSNQPSAPQPPTNSSSAAAAAATGVIQTSPRRSTVHDQLPQQERLQQNSTGADDGAAPSSHVVSGLLSDDDDELLDDRNVPNSRWLVTRWRRNNATDQQQQQQQPTSDSPYSPIADEAPLSRWQRFKSLFTRRPADAEEEDDAEPRPQPAPSALLEPTAAAAASSTTITATNITTSPDTVGSSNNILNVHLAGSFHGSEDTTDDELLGAMSRDVAKRRQFRSAPDVPSTSVTTTERVWVGVPALPNPNFNPTAQPDAIPDYLHPITLPAGPGNGRSAGSRAQPRRSRNRGRPPHSGGGGGGAGGGHIV